MHRSHGKSVTRYVNVYNSKLKISTNNYLRKEVVEISALGGIHKANRMPAVRPLVFAVLGGLPEQFQSACPQPIESL